MALMARRAASVPPGLSPERTALGEAIAAALAAKQKRDAALSTEAPAQRAVRAAEEAVEDATERLHRAKASAASSASASMLAGDVLELPPALRPARATLADAEDRLDVARAMRDQLNARRADVDAETSQAQATVEAARDAVIRAEGAVRAKALTAELIATQRRMMELADELTWLHRAGAVPVVQEHGNNFGKPVDVELRKALFRTEPMNQPMQGDRLIDLVPSPSPSMIWTAAATALEQDAHAALPTAL